MKLKQTSPAEILLRSKDRKRQKISERNRGYYRHNKGKTVLNDDSGEASKWAVYKRGQRERKSKLQLKLTDTQKKKIYREKRKLQQQNSQEIGNIYVFPNRMSKLRAKRKLEAALPRTPERRSAVLMSVFEGTHVRRCLDFETSVLRDLKETVTELKSKRSDDARAALNVITASIAGGNVIELFQYFTEILRTYPSHSFRASWQNKQMRKLIECLPPDECVAIHDFSENYSCSEKDELQSTFFSKAECTLHVTILYRHARVDIDGEEMTENKRIVCEQFFVISPDIKHDNYFSKNVQKLVSDYLKEINYHVNCMHEFTDGCSVQYKSRNCMGDVSLSSDLGYGKIIRNYFETSHAKGQQDAAGGCIKHMADMAVIRGTSVIQNAQDLFDFAVHNLSSTKSKNKRRLFRYIDQADRSELRNFKPIKNNRKIHQIISENSDGLLKIRDLSCYSCDTCLDGNVTLCTNRSYCGQVTQVKMVQTQTKTNETSDTCENSPDFRSLVGKGVVVAVYTDDNDSEYYLLQVVASPFILSSFSTDQWGNSFDAGTDVLRGYYYDKVDDQRYKLLSGRIAIVPTLSIRYIVSAVGCYKKSITILDETHIDIMESIDIHDMYYVSYV